MMSVNKFLDKIASISIPATELNSLKSHINELEARIKAQDQHQNLSQSLIQNQPSPIQSETFSLRIIK